MLLALILRQRLTSWADLFTGATKTVALSLAMGFGVWGALALLPETQTWSGSLLRVVGAVTTGLVGYLGLAMLLRSPELKWLVRGT